MYRKVCIYLVTRNFSFILTTLGSLEFQACNFLSKGHVLASRSFFTLNFSVLLQFYFPIHYFNAGLLHKYIFTNNVRIVD